MKMNCPSCSTPMIKGSTAVKSTFKGWLVYGWSFKHLFFRPDGKGKQKMKLILKNNTVTKAHYCPSCGITVVYPDGKGPITYF